VFTYPGATPATKTAIITQTQFNDTTDVGTVTLISGDPNGDGQINMLDWPYLADSLGSALGSPTYNPSCDFNSDGKIDIWDFMIFRTNFGEQQQGGKGMNAKTRTRDRAIALRFEPNSIDNAKIGEIITLNILISGAKDSYGGEVHLSFNPDVLEAIAVNKGDWIQNPQELMNRIDNNKGKIDLALGSIKPITESSGLFAKIRFRVKAEGESLIKFEFDTEANRRTLFIEKDYVVPEITPDEGKIEVIPSVSILLQSYPNPAKDSCFIPFKLSEDADVTVEICNILGQKVKTIDAGYKKAGLYIAKEKALFCNLRNDRGDKLAQGLYFINLKAGKYSGRQRLVIQR
ncbi:MAG: cohesin domain-containing protein, partial [bacterium]